MSSSPTPRRRSTRNAQRPAPDYHDSASPPPQRKRKRSPAEDEWTELLRAAFQYYDALPQERRGEPMGVFVSRNDKIWETFVASAVGQWRLREVRERYHGAEERALRCVKRVCEMVVKEGETDVERVIGELQGP